MAYLKANPITFMHLIKDRNVFCFMKLKKIFLFQGYKTVSHWHNCLKRSAYQLKFNFKIFKTVIFILG